MVVWHLRCCGRQGGGFDGYFDRLGTSIVTVPRNSKDNLDGPGVLSDPIVIGTLALAIAVAAGIATTTARGWRAVVVFAAFLPALGLWALLLSAAVYAVMFALGAIPVD